MIQKIGTIIRIHKAPVVSIKGIKCFKVNVSINSSWLLFQSADALLKEKKKEKKNKSISYKDEEYLKYLSEDIDISDDNENEMLTQEEIKDKRLYKPIGQSG